jgi:CoA:oxalate CoA-transferase
MAKLSPLQGIRVIDFTSMMAGPFGTRLLADCGAELIKVEPLTGDYMRARPPRRDGSSSYYGQMNCGKKSVAIDLKSPKGREVARRLIAGADIVVENFRPGVMRDLGLDYDSLKEEFPDLIYCSISGFGQTGSRARDPAYAPIIHAASGLDMAHMSCNAELERPQVTCLFTADAVAAIYAFGAIQTALVHRERHGGGQYIDVSLLDATLNLLVFEFQEAQFPTRQRRPLYQPVKAKDGFVMVAPVNQKNFENLADAVGHPEWKSDSRFSNNRIRGHNWGDLMKLVEVWTSERSAQDCERILMRAHVPCSRFKTVEELLHDEELRSSGSFAEVGDRAGKYLVPNPPFRFSNANVRAREWVSEVSEDRMEILAQAAGLSEAEIRELERTGVVGTEIKDESLNGSEL